MDVWVIESGECEQRGVVGVAVSPDAAADFVRSKFPSPPYIVEWSRPDLTTLIGDFTAVIGWSTTHRQIFDFTEYQVAELAQEESND